MSETKSTKSTLIQLWEPDRFLLCLFPHYFISRSDRVIEQFGKAIWIQPWESDRFCSVHSHVTLSLAPTESYIISARQAVSHLIILLLSQLSCGIMAQLIQAPVIVSHYSLSRVPHFVQCTVLWYITGTEIPCVWQKTSVMADDVHTDPTLCVNLESPGEACGGSFDYKSSPGLCAACFMSMNNAEKAETMKVCFPQP